jgi:hypothetical protein
VSHAAYDGKRTKRVTLNATSERGGKWKVDAISLHFQRDSVDCSLNFSGPEELEKYIESFRSGAIPVTFDVKFDRTGKPSGALLMQVGTWDASKIPLHERSLTTTQKIGHLKPGQTNVLNIDSPGACFDPISPE